MVIECRAQRLLNPFRGVVHIIRYGAAEAVTSDGEHWDIYVSNDELLRGLPSSVVVQTSDIRYGSWSLAKGLKRGPIYPSDDFLRMEAMGAALYEYLLTAHDKLPFPFEDRYELWLLDIEGQPLALLQSVLSERELTEEPDPRWLAGLAARENFHSTATQQIGHTRSAAEYLSAYVNAGAGDVPSAQWFRRERDGSGTGLLGMNLSELFSGRQLPAEAFPPFMLAQCGHDEAHRQLIADYLAWQAPCLLLLAGLPLATRASLEAQARSQPFTVERQYRLYPEMADPALIQAARVEAMLCRSQAAQEEVADTPPYYIELNPAGGTYT